MAITGFWTEGLVGSPDNMNATLLQRDTLANRPAAGQLGVHFMATDTFDLYRDNGSTWDLLGRLVSTGAQTFAGVKTLASPVINTALTGSAVGPGASQVAAGDHGISDHHALFVRKTSDETINNVGALQNDDDLVFAAAANTTYIVTYVLFCNGNPTADIYFDFSVPSGTTEGHGHIAPALGITDEEDTNIDIRASTGDLLAGLLVATSIVVIIHSIFVVGGTPGNIQLQWAQNVATVANTIVTRESYMLVDKVE